MDDALRLHALEVRRAALRGAALVDVLQRVPFRERDAFVDLVLGLDDIPDDIALPRGSVPYIPCGVDAILHAIADAPITERDVFCDYGAGVGRVCALVHMLTGARAIGVELQPQLVERSRRLGVDVTQGDARDFAADADVHFMYASFDSTVLRCVLDRIRARDRGVVIAVGFDIDEPWLQAMSSTSPEVALYRFGR